MQTNINVEKIHNSKAENLNSKANEMMARHRKYNTLQSKHRQFAYSLPLESSLKLNLFRKSTKNFY